LEKGPARAVGRDLFPALARHQTLEESAYQDLRRAIVEGRFAPGERIVAASVAASAGISRIPVMQALQRLQPRLVPGTPRRWQGRARNKRLYCRRPIMGRRLREP